ncbi:uncharacterized protein B0H18DRAFT_1215747 [Fomitopsis serialis]|uniref:uncharacterized protein n=1 Tax=Fomitopsis serialis TaxID=139415 RepID=UPI0020080EFC|nr:uncharacterized protein B0H18DRAFT_1215747 [Neoantrodia serialis]KAH9914956.1 hypothetical protein B0H18DRAFT_1215747 [Neoantrodia serialis]
MAQIQALSWYLMRDGTFYFVIMLTLNIVDIVVVVSTQTDMLTSTMISPLSVFFLARLLLNLRAAAHSSGASSGNSGFLDVSSPRGTSTLNFAGEPVEDDTDTELTTIISPSRDLTDGAGEGIELSTIRDNSPCTA